MADQPQTFQCGQCGYRATLPPAAAAAAACPRCGASNLRPAGEAVAGARRGVRRQASVLLTPESAGSTALNRSERPKHDPLAISKGRDTVRHGPAVHTAARATARSGALRAAGSSGPVANRLIPLWRYLRSRFGRRALAGAVALVIGLMPAGLADGGLPPDGKVAVLPDAATIAAGLGDLEYALALAELDPVTAALRRASTAAAGRTGGGAPGLPNSRPKPMDEPPTDAVESDLTDKMALARPMSDDASGRQDDPAGPVQSGGPAMPIEPAAASRNGDADPPRAEPDAETGPPGDIASHSVPADPLARPAPSFDTDPVPTLLTDPVAADEPIATSNAASAPLAAAPAVPGSPVGAAAPPGPDNAPKNASPPDDPMAAVDRAAQTAGATPPSGPTATVTPAPSRLRDPVALMAGLDRAATDPTRRADGAGDDSGANAVDGSNSGGGNTGGDGAIGGAAGGNATAPADSAAAPARPFADPAPACNAERGFGRTVVIMDASLSMGLPIDMPHDLEHELDRRMDSGDTADSAAARETYRDWLARPGSKRLDAARAAFAKALADAPDRIDLGVVSFTDCSEITSAGPASGTDRARLIDHVDRLVVRRGGDTPLADSLDYAGGMLGILGDHIILITDGQETCGGDPCAVAARLKRHYPKLRIDLVDLSGNAAAQCVPRSTGGRFIQFDDLAVEPLALTLGAALTTCPTGPARASAR